MGKMEALHEASSIISASSVDEYSRSNSGRGLERSMSIRELQQAARDVDKHPKGEEEVGIAKAENKAVFRSRLLMVTFLAICTVTVAILVYRDTSNGEKEQLKTDFEDLSSKTIESLGSRLEASVGAIDAFVVSIVSYAKNNGMEWPYVTTPDFGVRASKVLAVANSIVLMQIQLVPAEQEEEWNAYSLREGPAWIDANIATQNEDPGYRGIDVDSYVTSGVWLTPPENDGILRPSWQTYPTIPIYGFSPMNLDVSIVPNYVKSIAGVQNRKAVIGGVFNDPNTFTYEQANEQLEFYLGSSQISDPEPLSEIHYPIIDNAANKVNGTGTGNLVGVMGSWFLWRSFLTDTLPSGSDGVVVVFENECNQTFSYQIDGPEATFMGHGDAHDPAYNGYKMSYRLMDVTTISTGTTAFTGAPLSDEACPYTLSFYPSSTFESNYVSSDPLIYTSVAVAIFVFTTFVFLVYDFLVERRQKKVMTTAVKSSAIVSSLFPSNVRARLYGMDEVVESAFESSNQQPQKRSRHEDASEELGPSMVDKAISTGRPIADLFPSTTVMFGDIAGFTAWSSTRQPHQVFILLESLYGLFDSIAEKMGVFKVETIGDCYMAVAGLPDPRPDHAVVCAKFASECNKRMVELTSKLALKLGPDTEELTMRFGLNSGPVTAGVLRGQKTRFQLFGDTVNTASRMESTGLPNHIQASESTAKELKKHKKGHWLSARDERVEVKGKGQMETYWVEPSDGSSNTARRSGVPAAGLSTKSSGPQLEARINRLVDWNADVLARLLRSIEARRRSLAKGNISMRRVEPDTETDDSTNTGNDNVSSSSSSSNLVIDEVREIVSMANFVPSRTSIDPESINLSPKVMEELTEYVTSIAKIYANFANPFHNFEHASHVCMSVAKLMSRIIAADETFDSEKSSNDTSGHHDQAKHERTFGITSDPLTIFACAFSALIHDVDHQGVPNSQLVKEGTDLAVKYHNRSVAEQHSIDVAWALLMSQRFSALRRTIASTPRELQRFRQLVVNSVMATDIMDKELKQLRNERWDRAFSDESGCSDKNCAVHKTDCCAAARNRKATIVIEHLIQASDVSHTMQHWHVYRKWNERLFMEMSAAFENGRSDKDPAEFWYKGELGFFDFYILPLAKKLSDCGVFGVSSDEYLNYALKNREEWELKGKDIVEGMIQRRQLSFNGSHGSQILNVSGIPKSPRTPSGRQERRSLRVEMTGAFSP